MKKERLKNFLFILGIVVVVSLLSFIIFNKVFKKEIPLIENDTYYKIVYITTYSNECPLDLYNGDYILIDNVSSLKSVLSEIGDVNYSNKFDKTFFEGKTLVLVSAHVSARIEKISVIGNSVNILTASAGTHYGLIDDEMDCDYYLIPIDKKITNIKVEHYYYDKDYDY